MYKEYSLNTFVIIVITVIVMGRYNLGYYDSEATIAQGYRILHLFKPSDPEDSYINMIYTNVQI